jgi:hypothetical protein
LKRTEEASSKFQVLLEPPLSPDIRDAFLTLRPSKYTGQDEGVLLQKLVQNPVLGRWNSYAIAAVIEIEKRSLEIS